MDDQIVSHRSEHRQLLQANRYAATVIFNILDQYLETRSILDLGCGTGVWMRTALVKPGRTAFGVELEAFPPDELAVAAESIVNISIGNVFDLHRRFDLVLCLETAEHLAGELGANVVEKCVTHSDTVLFSAAIPGQGGLNHLNEQVPEYWVDLFARRNYAVIDLLRPLIWNDKSIPVWYRQNMLLFVNRSAEATLDRLQATARMLPVPLARAHPDLLAMHAHQTELCRAELTHQRTDLGAARAEVQSLVVQKQRADESLAAAREASATEIAKLEARLSHAHQSLRESEEMLRRERRHSQETLHRESDARQQLFTEREALQQRLAEKQGLQRVAERMAARAEHAETEVRRVKALSESWLRNVHSSTSWRLTAPARAIAGGFNALRGRPWSMGFQPWDIAKHWGDLPGSTTGNEEIFTAAEQSAHRPTPPAAVRRDRVKVVFVSGEPQIPGHRYRISSMVAALPGRYFDTVIVALDELRGRMDEIRDTDLLWIWRAAWSETLAEAVITARGFGAKFVFDIDDLMFRPELATVAEIDGIRTQNLEEAAIADLYAGIRKTVAEADLCVTTTSRLARELARIGKTAVVIPNGYQPEARRLADKAVAAAQDIRQDGCTRIGYAAGSRTHQRDFAVAVPALAQVLSARPTARLVLTRGSLDLDEFPALRDLSAQIEWRDFVPLDLLFDEYARYSINIVPLEVGNRFTEAKSELKYFEAALVGVPTVASPTAPYAAAIRNGETGFLASAPEEWQQTLLSLAADPDRRQRVADAARHEALWKYGPERRSLLMRRTIAGLLAEPAIAACAFTTRLDDELRAPAARVEAPSTAILFESERRGESRVAVVIPCYNYAHFIEEALQSVLDQTYRDIDVIVIDDCSTDDSVAVTRSWLTRHAASFNRVALLQNQANAKLGASRNAAIAYAGTELFLPLDPDNILLADCIERCLAAIDETGAAVAYPKIESFGDTGGQTWYLSAEPWQPDRFRAGNYIDAMALVRTSCWAAVGGYVPFLYGWEDYDLWCRFIEHGFFGVNVPHVGAKYRYHRNQMIETTTKKSLDRVIEEMRARHPWTDPE